MATQLQELQAKRKELQATNPNASMLDARNALTPAISNAPVAGQTGNNMPISQAQADFQKNNEVGKIVNAIGGDTEQRQTTREWANQGMSQEEIQSIYNRPNWGKPRNTGAVGQSFDANAEREKFNQQVLAQNQARVQTEIQTGTRPPVGTQATPEQVPQIVQQVEAQKPVEQVALAVQAPAQPAQETTPEVKKEPKPIEVAPPPMTIGDMYNNLVNRVDVTPEMKALPTFKIAQNRYNKANMYASMSPSELSSEMKSAKLIEGSPAWEDLKTMNPGLVQSVKALNTVNGVKPEIFTYVNNPDGTRSKENNLTKAFVSDYEDNYGDIVSILRGIYGVSTAEEARNKIYTQDVRNAEAKATEIELQMNALSDTISNIDKDVEQEFKGTGATGSRIELEKQYRNEQLENKNRSLLKNYITYANKANNLITQNTDLYKSEQEQKKALQTALAGVAMTQYQTQLGLQTKQAEMQMESDFAKKQAYENINDPATAISNMMAMYQQKGIPFTQSLQTKLSEFANSGMSLGQYLDQMTKDIQAKPEYKALTATKPAEAPTTKEIDVGGKKVTVQWNGKEWTPVQGANIERAVATQTYGTTPAVRNFNPGNIMDTGFGGRRVEGERFTVFDSPQEGFNALVSKIQNIQAGNSKVYSPDMTLLQYIGKYAPSSDGNNPKAYATAIANNLGISIDTKIGQIDPVKLAEEHARHEDANSYRMLQDLGIIGGGINGRGIADATETKIMNIGKIAYGKTVSDKEGARIESLLKKFPNASTREIALAVRGLNVPEDKADTAMQYIRVFDKMKTPPEGFEATVGDYINRNDMAGLQNYVNKHIENDVKANTSADVFIPTSVLNSGNKNINEIISLINKNKDKIGIVDGNYTKLLKKFSGERDVQRLQSLMTATFANLRKNFAGSAVTSTELSALKDFIAGDITEVPENLITKLETLRDMQNYEYEQQRSPYGIQQTQTPKVSNKEAVMNTLSQIAEAIRQAKSSVK